MLSTEKTKGVRTTKDEEGHPTLVAFIKIISLKVIFRLGLSLCSVTDAIV
jgi:hypothetical protein